MTKQMKRRVLRAAVTVAALGLTVWPAPPGSAARSAAVRPAVTAATAECQGDACAQVTLAPDEAGQKFVARNNSSDRWVRVSASNMASYAGACLGPGKEAALNLKSIVGPYRADYAAPKCETPDGR